MNGKVFISGSKLKELRSKRGLSQEALCDVFYCQKIQVSIATLKRAELGKNVSYRVARELALYFDVTVEALLESSISNNGHAELFGEKRKEIYLFSFLVTTQYDYCTAHEQQIILTEIASYLTKQDFNVIDVIGHYLLGSGLQASNNQVLYHLLYIYKHVSSKFEQCNITLCVKKSIGLTKGTVLQVTDQDIEELACVLQHTKENIFIVDNECYLQEINNFAFTPIELFPNIEKQYFQLTKNSLDATTLFGRDEELYLFNNLMDDQVAIDGLSILNVYGDSGIGKSELCKQFCELARKHYDEENSVGFIQCIPEQPSHKSSLISKIIFCLLNLEELLSDNEIQLYFSQLRNKGEWLDEELFWLEEIFDEYPLSTLDKQYFNASHHQKQGLVKLICKAFQKAKLSVLCIDDLHISDRFSLQLLAQTFEQLSGKSIIIVFSSQVAWSAYNTDFPLLNKVFKLSPLSEVNTCLLAETWFAADTEYRQQCVEISAGNPLFLQQLLCKTSGDSTVPSSLLQLLEYRISALTEQQKLMLWYSATYGRLVLIEVMEQLIEGAEVLLNELSFANLIQRVNPLEFKFSHNSIYEKVVELIPQSNRKELHKAITDALIQSDLDDQYLKNSLVAYHYYRQDKLIEAVDHYHQAALVAKGEGNYRKGLASVHDGLNLLSKVLEPLKEIELRLVQLTLLKACHGWASLPIKTTLLSISALCKKSHDHSSIRAVIFNQWLIKLMALELDEALQLAKELNKLSRRKKDQCAEVHSLSALSNTLFWQGRFNESIESAKQALALYLPSFHQRDLSEFGQDPRIVAHLFLVLSSSLKGEEELARQGLRDMQTICQKIHSPFTEAIAMQGYAFFHYHQQEVKEVEQYAAQLLKLAEQHSIPFFIGVAKLFLGWSIAKQGDRQQGLLWLNEGYHQWLAKSGDKMPHSLYCCLTAEILIDNEQPTEALSVTITGIQFSIKHREESYLSHLYYFKALAEHQLKLPILDTLNKATDIATKQQAYLFIRKINHIKEDIKNEQTKLSEFV